MILPKQKRRLFLATIVTLLFVSCICLPISASGGDVPCTEHSYIEAVAEKYMSSPADCTKAAVYFKSCSVCGEKGSETFESGEAAGHSWSYTSDANSHYLSCTRTGCGETQAPDAHKYSSSWSYDETSHYHTCTVCGARQSETNHTFGEYFSNGNDTHSGKCSVCSYEDTQACFGGTATCTQPAGCTVCNTAHGDVNSNNHFYNTDLTIGDSTHYYDCRRCGDKKGEAPHEYKDHLSNGDGIHTGKCICGKTHTENCSGGVATCTSAARCQYCNAFYGGKNPANHDFSSNLTDGGDTHYYSCSRCGEKSDEQSHSYKNYTSNNDGTHTGHCSCGKPSVGNCSGGTADCIHRARCSTCGEEYGSIDSTNHRFSASLVVGESTHYYECSDCRKKTDEAAHSFSSYTSDGNGSHSASCICGKKDTENCHYPTALTKGETTHYYECAVCHSRSGEERHEYKDNTSNGNDIHSGKCICGAVKTESCSGIDASATCQEKAVCSVCGSGYGALADHKFDMSAWGYKSAAGHAHICTTGGCDAHDNVIVHISGGSATENTPEICTDCGYIITPAIGHINHAPLPNWSSDATHHWKGCTGCEDQQFERAEHDYDHGCDSTCNTCGYVRHTAHNYVYDSNENEHWQKCSACGVEKENSRDLHSGGKATCTSRVKCAYCGALYGTLNESYHSGSSYIYTSKGDGTHEKKYSCCKALVRSDEKCSGGVATCQDRAICSKCDKPYGDLAEHDFDMSKWGFRDSDGHAHICTEKDCNAHDALEKHTSSGPATDNTPEICTVCKAILNPALNHTEHTPKTEWESDDKNHWHDCSGCDGQQLDKNEHRYDSSCDESCNDCGYKRDVIHNYSEEKRDDNGRWYQCVCGAVSGYVEHAFSGDDTCDRCGYVRGSSTDETTVPPASSGNNAGCNCKKFPWWILPVIAICLIAARVIYKLFADKKTENKESEASEEDTDNTPEDNSTTPGSDNK